MLGGMSMHCKIAVAVCARRYICTTSSDKIAWAVCAGRCICMCTVRLPGQYVLGGVYVCAL